MRDRRLMRKHVIVYAWAFASALVVGYAERELRGQEDQGSALKDRVMRELPSALARVDALYSNVTASGTVTEERRRVRSSKGAAAKGGKAEQAATAMPTADLESAWSRKVVLQASHGLRKVFQTLVFDKQYDEKTNSMRDSPETPARPAKSAICIAGEYSFRLRWVKDVPILTSYEAANDKGTTDSINYWHQLLLEAPCGIFAGRHMSQLMSLPSFSIRKVTRTPGPSGENLLVEFEYAPSDLGDHLVAKGVDPAKGARPRQCWIELSPSDAWAIRAFGFGRGPTAGSPGPRNNVVYGSHRNGVPVPVRISLFEPGPQRTRTLEIESVDFAPIADREFTLSFYGLPELNASPRSARGNRLAVAAFVLALVTLCGSIALKYYASTRKKA
jgi:hypothetical protein